MKNKTIKRQYVRGSKTWYHDSKRDKTYILLGIYKNDDIWGEFEIEWYPLNNRLVPRLKAFDDSWEVLSHFADLLQKMGEIDNECIDEEDFAKILDELGIKDVTQYENPKPNLNLLEKYYVYREDNKKASSVEKIVFKILDDITDRRGLSQEWSQINEDIKEEILDKWHEIVSKNT